MSDGDGDFDSNDFNEEEDFDEEIPTFGVEVVDVVQTASEFESKIKESIETNVVSPYGHTELEEKKAGIQRVFDCVKEGFKRSPGDRAGSYRTKFQDLMKLQDYRYEMPVFTDLIISLVDTMAEADVEVFGNVKGITKVVQEMFRKYVCK